MYVLTLTFFRNINLFLTTCRVCKWRHFCMIFFILMFRGPNHPTQPWRLLTRRHNFLTDLVPLLTHKPVNFLIKWIRLFLFGTESCMAQVILVPYWIMNPITYKVTRLITRKYHTTPNLLLSYCVEQASAKWYQSPLFSRYGG